MNRRFSSLDGNPANRRFSTLDGTPIKTQDPENVPSHRCLLLDQSFEALKSARSSTEAMKRVNQELQQTVQTEAEKNRLYQQDATEYEQFSEKNDKNMHGMSSTTEIAPSGKGSKENMTKKNDNNLHGMNSTTEIAPSGMGSKENMTKTRHDKEVKGNDEDMTDIRQDKEVTDSKENMTQTRHDKEVTKNDGPLEIRHDKLEQVTENDGP